MPLPSAAVVDPDLQLVSGGASPPVGANSGLQQGTRARDDTRTFMNHGPLYAVNVRSSGVLVDQITVLYGKPGGPQAKVGTVRGKECPSPGPGASLWGALLPHGVCEGMHSSGPSSSLERPRLGHGRPAQQQACAAAES
jgi:hypothetical protein